ncbi:MAG TPA: DNA polymerase III subunit gamma/tau, partial [Rhodospirillales bacterium]|nr:DNA polymerase III subunit gamma/tau [Rhodospirillales bacterium]
MYQVLARKYRPQTFAELIGQEHVRATLENAIAQGRIAHGYIFSGQRGTGKTTVARILARCLNCEQGPTTTPCGTCASCREVEAGSSVDVIEIDAASNRGINEMRELRESIKYRPARDRYKIFIIDEAHQITNEAFNALLKTLEEPPEWVVFVLCTTEAHKIPTTIASRCQQFAFRSVEFDLVIERMRWICEREGIEAEPEALAVLAQAGEGSVRDSLSALDQAIACCGKKLTGAEIRELLGMFSIESLHQVTEALEQADSKRMLEIVQELERNGRNLQHFCRELARYFRNLLVVKVAGAGTRLVPAAEAERKRLAEIAAGFSEEDLTRYLQLTLDLFRELQFALQPRLHLEVGLLRLVHAGRLVSIEEALAAVGGGGSAPAASSGGGARTAAGGASPRPAGRKSAPAPATATSGTAETPAAQPPEAPEAPAPASNGSGEWKKRLHGAAAAQGLTFVADAIEHAEVVEAGGELRFRAPREFLLSLGSSDMKKLVASVAGRPMKIKVEPGEAQAAGPADEALSEAEDEAAARALSHPEVQEFQR